MTSESTEDLLLQYAEAQLAQQTRAANYLAILTYITVITLILSVAAGVFIAIVNARN